MTLAEAASLLGAAIGGGGLAKIATKWLDRQRAKTRSDADLAARVLDHVEAEREDTERHITGIVECERRCAALAAENAALRTRVEQLEHEMAWMKNALVALMDGRDPNALADVVPIRARKDG